MVLAGLVCVTSISYVHHVSVLLRVDRFGFAAHRCRTGRSSESAWSGKHLRFETSDLASVDAFPSRGRIVDLHDFYGLVQCTTLIWRQRSRPVSRNFQGSRAWRQRNGDYGDCDSRCDITLSLAHLSALRRHEKVCSGSDERCASCKTRDTTRSKAHLSNCRRRVLFVVAVSPFGDTDSCQLCQRWAVDHANFSASLHG